MSFSWENLTGFGLLSAVFFLVPFLPAIRALARPPQKVLPKDSPLSPLSQCETFRHLVSRQFGNLISAARERGTIQGRAENGRPYIVLGLNNYLADEVQAKTRRIKASIIASGHLDIPPELICEREIFAEGKINVGHSTMIRCALSPRDIAINSRARVTRWVRSNRRLDIAERASVKGWARADIEITLARRARFEHLSSPLISFGRQAEPLIRTDEYLGRYTPPSNPEGKDKHIRNLSIPDRHITKGDLIATETLKAGKACSIIGALRAGTMLVIGPHSRVEGAIYCDGDIVIHEGCQISGPVVAGASLLIHANTRIGSPENPTTLVAPRIRIAEACVAHGTVEARQRGEVFLEEPSKTPSRT